MKKAKIKKITKKTSKKKIVKTPAKTRGQKKPKKKLLQPKKIKQEKPIGVVTHYFGNIRVAIVKFKVPIRQGSEVWFRGYTTNFLQAIKSMQFDHKVIAVAPKGKQVGIKVSKKVRPGDGVFKNI